MDKFSSVVTRLKLRGSYGLVGNDAIGDQRFYESDVNLSGGGIMHSLAITAHLHALVFISIAMKILPLPGKLQANESCAEMTLLKHEYHSRGVQQLPV
ncbi:hypothetical protein CS542_02015 [Pedobacter sp. IW39]|nr:hypothetical protein CS542_02015 [Pedobacter sp. IW39]